MVAGHHHFVAMGQPSQPIGGRSQLLGGAVLTVIAGVQQQVSIRHTQVLESMMGIAQANNSHSTAFGLAFKISAPQDGAAGKS
jgi:hypothetical protein